MGWSTAVAVVSAVQFALSPCVLPTSQHLDPAPDTLGAAGEPAEVEGVGSWEIQVAESTLAVVTFRGGVAGRLAHDHLIHAGDFSASLSLDPDEPEEASFSGSVQVQDLVVDDPERMERVQPLIHSLDLMEREFGEIDADERAEVRQEMLSPGQLDARAHPEIHFEALDVWRDEEAEYFPWRARVALTVRGETQETELRGRWLEENGTVRVLLGGHLRFTDFGIEPFRAVLGTVRNQDTFALFLDLVARPVE